MKPKTVDLARGKWRGVLKQLGVSDLILSGRHGPCPGCGGKDRFRFDNKGGEGAYICEQCGAGNGFKLLQMVHGWDFAVAAAEVDKVLGNVKSDRAKPPPDEVKRRDDMNRLWRSGTAIQADCPVGRYLAARDLKLPSTGVLRYVERCPVPKDEPSDPQTWLPAMVALVSDRDGKPATLHRTFLGPNGKADIPRPRAVMPGPLPEGSAVRLGEHFGWLGIAEGIETALKASEIFGLPMWAAINSTMLEKWIPPDDVKQVDVFGDNDPKFGGQKAAYALAHRLAVKGLEVTVHIPTKVGTDWADHPIRS